MVHFNVLEGLSNHTTSKTLKGLETTAFYTIPVFVPHKDTPCNLDTCIHPPGGKVQKHLTQCLCILTGWSVTRNSVLQQVIHPQQWEFMTLVSLNSRQRTGRRENSTWGFGSTMIRSRRHLDRTRRNIQI